MNIGCINDTRSDGLIPELFMEIQSYERPDFPVAWNHHWFGIKQHNGMAYQT
jgi:hypothetical protein